MSQSLNRRRGSGRRLGSGPCPDRVFEQTSARVCAKRPFGSRSGFRSRTGPFGGALAGQCPLRESRSAARAGFRSCRPTGSEGHATVTVVPRPTALSSQRTP
jgi:hypothetical protein